MKKANRSEKREVPSKQKDDVNKNQRRLKNEVCFEFCADPGSKVCLAGSFSNWKPLALKDIENNGKYARVVKLPDGRHEYKFIVNDLWLHDAGNPNAVANAFGSLNSIIEV